MDENGNIIYSYVREKKNKEGKNMRGIKAGDKILVNKKQFTKSDLKSGDMVELRNGEVYIFIKEAKRNQYDNPTDIFIGINSYHCIPLNRYSDNLLNSRGEKSYDIMKISNGFYIKNIFRPYSSATLATPDWVLERKETEEMTLEEVCKELGRDIKIIKEH